MAIKQRRLIVGEKVQLEEGGSWYIVRRVSVSAAYLGHEGAHNAGEKEEELHAVSPCAFVYREG